MFNKPNLFPKASENPQPRGARPVGSGAGGDSATGFHAASTSTAGQPAGSAAAVAASGRMDDSAREGESRLIVGPDVKLKGAEILDCDTLVVEGRVEATMDSRFLRIAEGGSFSGKVGVDVAEIYGQFDGELTTRNQLIIHATGKVSGKIRYGKIFIEEGGQICGDINAGSEAVGTTSRKPSDKERSRENQGAVQSEPLPA